MRFFLIFFINTLLFSSLHSEDIETILKITPPVKYDLNLKYSEVFKYKDLKSEEKEDKYHFGFDIDIDQELMTIDKLKIDIGTNFKGID